MSHGRDNVSDGEDNELADVFSVEEVNAASGDESTTLKRPERREEINAKRS